MKLAALLFAAATVFAEGLVVNLADAKWTRARDGTDSVTIREDDHVTEYLVRVPAGHAFRPHWHSVGERIVLIQGRLSLTQDKRSAIFLDAGGYALLPAREIQHTKCVSANPCAFYVHWDGKLDFHPE